MRFLNQPLVLAYCVAYFAFFLGCVRIWSIDPTILYIGRDSDFSIWLAHTYAEWAAPLSVTALNPFQGMGSMLMPVNPYFNPGAWIFATNLGLAPKFVISMTVYFLEVTITCFLLGRAIGFSKIFSFAAALWLGFLFFPPFNFIFGLQGVMATSPQWANLLAISNLILAFFMQIGNPAWSARGYAYAVKVNCAAVAGLIALTLIGLLTAPFYAAGTLTGTALCCVPIFVSSLSTRQALWRVAAAVCLLGIFSALGMWTFFKAAKSFTARFATGEGMEMSLPHFHWPVEISLSALASAQDWLCASAVLCNRLTFPGALTGAYWLHAMIILGAIAAWIKMPPPLSRLAGSFAVLWVGLLIFWLCNALGIITNTALGPIYFVVAVHPFWAFFSLFLPWIGTCFLARWFAVIAPRSFVTLASWAWPFVFPSGIVICSLAVAIGYGGYLERRSPLIPYYPQRGSFTVRKSDAIIDLLRQEISLHPGQPFRGSVATILGGRGGSLRRALGLPSTGPLLRGQFEIFLAKVGTATGNDHDMIDMWWLNLPTLSEYAQGISRPFLFYLTSFLKEPDDPIEHDIAFASRENVDVLGAMGVRFIITDTPQLDGRLTLRIKENIADFELYLYEIAKPNLGNYSPVEVENQGDLGTFRAVLNDDPAIISSRAFLQKPIGGRFTPASNAQMIFVEGGVQVFAASSASSLLLLPLQFSHCLRISDPRVEVLRADVIFTLLKFDGMLDAKLSWQYNFWGQGGCRAEDVADIRALGLLH